MLMTDISIDSLNWFGRNLDFENVRYFNYSASGFEFAFSGTKAICKIKSDSELWNNETKCWLAVYVSDLNEKDSKLPLDFWLNIKNEPDKRILIDKKYTEVVLFESEQCRTVHIRVLKLSEAAFAFAGFCGLKIDGTLLSNKNNRSKLKIQFIGDSITCGYGIDGVCEKDVFTTAQERADKSFAFLTAKKCNAEFQMVCWSGIGIISCYVPPEKNSANDEILMPLLYPYTDRSLSLRLNIEPEVYQHSFFKPDIIVINLGTNDASYTRQINERISAFVSGYRQLLETVHRCSPTSSIVACLGVMGQDLCCAVEKAASIFKKDFPQVSVSVLKFDVQNEKDGIGTDYHPNALTHKKMSEKLVEFIKINKLDVRSERS